MIFQQGYNEVNVQSQVKISALEWCLLFLAGSWAPESIQLFKYMRNLKV